VISVLVPAVDGADPSSPSASAEAEEFAPASNDPFDALLPVNFTVASHPPFEEQLLGSTLWPEVRRRSLFFLTAIELFSQQTEKLYGHGFEIIALAAAHQSPVIATACKATSPEHAVIRLYDTKSWKPVGSILAGHALTITSMKFSSNDRWLLSVSRDRTWRLFEKAGGASLVGRVYCWYKYSRLSLTLRRLSTFSDGQVPYQDYMGCLLGWRRQLLRHGLSRQDGTWPRSSFRGPANSSCCISSFTGQNLDFCDLLVRLELYRDSQV
jgi:WD40 repeat protein